MPPARGTVRRAGGSGRNRVTRSTIEVLNGTRPVGGGAEIEVSAIKLHPRTSTNPCVKAACVEFLGEHPDVALERVT